MTPQEEKKWQKEGLEDVIHRLEVTALRFLPRQDSEWDTLLRFRDKLKQHLYKKYK